MRIDKDVSVIVGTKDRIKGQLAALTKLRKAVVTKAISK